MRTFPNICLLMALWVVPVAAQQTNMTAPEKAKFCKATKECRTGVSQPQWVACMHAKGFPKTKAGDGFRICG